MIVPATSSWMISSVAMFVLVAVIAIINQNYCNRDDWYYDDCCYYYILVLSLPAFFQSLVRAEIIYPTAIENMAGNVQIPVDDSSTNYRYYNRGFFQPG